MLYSSHRLTPLPVSDPSASKRTRKVQESIPCTRVHESGIVSCIDHLTRYLTGRHASLGYGKSNLMQLCIGNSLNHQP